MTTNNCTLENGLFIISQRFMPRLTFLIQMIHLLY